MQTNSHPGLKKLLRYTFKVFKVLLLLLIILFAAVYIYVSVNKKKIIAEVTAEIGKKINGTVNIKDVKLNFFKNFPKVAVELNDVSVADTMYAVHKHLFFESREVYLTLSITKLIKKETPINGIRIVNGSIYMYTDTNGYTNKYLLKPKTSAPPAGTRATAKENELKSVKLDNFRIIIDDRQKEKLHDLTVENLDVKLQDSANGTRFDADADILVNSLAFNLQKGSFLKGKTFRSSLLMNYDKKTKILRFDNVNVKLAGQPFNLSGSFDLGDDDPQFVLKLNTKKASYDEIRMLLPQKISNSLGIVQLDKKLDADAFIAGPLHGGEPLLQVNFSVDRTKLATPFMDFEEATFKGFFTNEVVKGLPRKDPNSKIQITGFSAEWHGLPMKAGMIEILDLKTPQLTADLSANFELSKLNELAGSGAIQFRSGMGSVQLKYQGPMQRNNNTNSFLDGTMSFKNGNILYAPRGVEMKNVNGSLVFKNSDLFIQNIQTDVLGNNILMNGTAKNLLTLINTEPGKVNIDWNIYSPSLNLGSFIYLLKARGKSNSGGNGKQKIAQASDKIDKALEQGNLHVNLKTPQLVYKKFIANNVAADISLLQDQYIINNVSMNHAGGNLNLKGAVIGQSGGINKANLNVNMSNVNVTKLFTAFDNFGQDGITAQSLEGTLNTKLTASMLIKDDGRLLPSSIESVIDFSLKNGALNNYEPVKKLQNILFKNRDFENIRFAELKDRLVVHNQDITINRMEIESSILTMFVEGVFSNRGKTDISIQVPLSNLKKRKAGYVPENVGSDARGGRSIFIRGQPGPDGNIKFKLDLFKRYQKDKAGNVSTDPT